MSANPFAKRGFLWKLLHDGPEEAPEPEPQPEAPVPGAGDDFDQEVARLKRKAFDLEDQIKGKR